MNKISVITPTYNRQGFLNQAIHSFLSQDYENKEMIVVNDGGSIPEVPEGITLYNIDHVNQANAQNYGIEKATGDLICTLDDDDLLMPASLTERVKHFQDESIEVVWTGAIDIWQNGSHKAFHPVVKNQDIWNKDRIFINTMMWRKSIIDKLGYWFDNELTSNEDWEFKIRCLAECSCKPIDIYSVKHRCHPYMRSDAHRKTGELAENELLFKKKLYKKYKEKK